MLVLSLLNFRILSSGMLRSVLITHNFDKNLVAETK